LGFEVDCLAIIHEEFARITATFNDQIITILVTAATTTTYFFNHFSLKAASDAARINSINALASLYQRTLAAAPVPRNRLTDTNNWLTNKNLWRLTKPNN
jgi:hypothetical protein